MVPGQEANSDNFRIFFFFFFFFFLSIFYTLYVECTHYKHLDEVIH